MKSEMKFTDPKLVLLAKMDTVEPERFISYRVPTHYCIKYGNSVWRRVYSKGFGRAYIFLAKQELFLDDETLKRLADMPVTAPVTNREQWLTNGNNDTNHGPRGDQDNWISDEEIPF